MSPGSGTEEMTVGEYQGHGPLPGSGATDEDSSAAVSPRRRLLMVSLLAI
jgi:hypothetical protein